MALAQELFSTPAVDCEGATNGGPSPRPRPGRTKRGKGAEPEGKLARMVAELRSLEDGIVSRLGAAERLLGGLVSRRVHEDAGYGSCDEFEERLLAASPLLRAMREPHPSPPLASRSLARRRESGDVRARGLKALTAVARGRDRLRALEEELGRLAATARSQLGAVETLRLYEECGYTSFEEFLERALGPSPMLSLAVSLVLSEPPPVETHRTAGIAPGKPGEGAHEPSSNETGSAFDAPHSSNAAGSAFDEPPSQAKLLPSLPSFGAAASDPQPVLASALPPPIVGIRPSKARAFVRSALVCLVAALLGASVGAWTSPPRRRGALEPPGRPPASLPPSRWPRRWIGPKKHPVSNRLSRTSRAPRRPLPPRRWLGSRPRLIESRRLARKAHFLTKAFVTKNGGVNTSCGIAAFVSVVRCCWFDTTKSGSMPETGGRNARDEGKLNRAGSSPTILPISALEIDPDDAKLERIGRVQEAVRRVEGIESEPEQLLDRRVRFGQHEPDVRRALPGQACVRQRGNRNRENSLRARGVKIERAVPTPHVPGTASCAFLVRFAAHARCPRRAAAEPRRRRGDAACAGPSAWSVGRPYGRCLKLPCSTDKTRGSVKAQMLARIRVSTPDRLIATWQRVMILIWKVHTTMPGVDAAQRVYDAFAAEHPAGIFLLTVVEQDAPMPSSEVRAALATFLSTGASQTLFSAVAHEGTGFQAASVRSVVTGLAMLAKLPYPHKVFASVEQAARWFWMSSPIANAWGETALVEAVHDVRANVGSVATA